MGYFTPTKNWTDTSAMRQDVSPLLSEYQPKYGAFEGLGSAFGGVLTGSYDRAIQLLGLAGGSALHGAASLTGSDTLERWADLYFSDVAEVSKDIENRRSLAAGWGSQVVHNLLDVGTSFAIGGPIGASVAQAAGSGVESVNEGDSTSIAVARTVLAGLTTYAGAKIPASVGGNFIVRAGSGAGGNIALGLASREAEKGIYSFAGEQRRADDIRVFDGVAIAADTIIGAAFGIMHGHSALDKIQETRKPKPTTEQLDAAFAVKDQQVVDNAAPEQTADPVKVAANRAAVDEVIKADVERREPDLSQVKEEFQSFDKSIEVPELSMFAKLRAELESRVAAERQSADVEFMKQQRAERITESMKAPLDPRVDPLSVAIRKLGGLSKDDLASDGVDPADMTAANKSVPGHPLFSIKGNSLDGMRESLAEYGYEYDMISLRNAVDYILRGKDNVSDRFIHRSMPTDKEMAASLNGAGIKATAADVTKTVDAHLNGKTLTPKQAKIIEHIGKMREEMHGVKKSDVAAEHAKAMREAINEEAVNKANSAMDNLKNEVGQDQIVAEQNSIEDQIYQSANKDYVDADGKAVNADAEIEQAMHDLKEGKSLLESIKNLGLCLVKNNV